MNASKLKTEIAKLKETMVSISEIVGDPPSEDSLEMEFCMSISNIMDEIAIMEDLAG